MDFNSLFEYKDGELYWKVARSNRVKVGQKTGWVSKIGYVYVNVNKIPTCAHRIIFAMHYGHFPEQVDHINGNKSDNRIENLRAATRSENYWNAKTRADNTSGIKGIHWESQRNKWRASCNKHGKRYDAGFFDDIEEAKTALHILRSSIHGNFAKHQ